ncbi:glyoxylate/hydroxypyruvate reductase A [Achromobacter sp. GG226]|uniref:2-hydroxyacid dehydrogenase n=1 Tax=Verticiella alkaliphila TaxID=2779529 RepID=UPI001C0C21BB|nr:glyoxylate/hydroxypyruvate reductase A [Verticiella sp. GG226]MBU4610733.1 glyoxylate/hydroxypyruvate reductase A [Verticiella sp. GG226]
MHLLLAITGDPKAQRWIEAFQRQLPDARISVWSDDAEPVDADYAVVWHPPAALFTRETRLRAVFNIGAGVDGLLSVPTLPADLPVIRLEDAGMSVQMAEYVLHALWEVSRDFAAYRRQEPEGNWKVLPVTRREQWTVGVLGLGQVGRRVAEATASFGYPTAGWSRTPREIAGIETFAGSDALPAFLARTRVLVNVLPLTDDTRDILAAPLFAQLPQGAHVINVGRGQHLVEDDLLAALESGQLAGATLDVFRTEPLPAEHAFWRHPAITVTPHTAARTLRAESVAQIAGKIRRLESGEDAGGQVERGRGY